jgi:uncharacterized cupin superfamily protein
MSEDNRPAAIDAALAPLRASKSNYPEIFHARVTRRQKQPLGDLFGLTVFGVNRTRIAPGGMSALRHAHSLQDEFVYILEGEPVLVSNAGEVPMKPGMCAGFKAATGDAHQLVNRTDRDVVYLEIGDRGKGDEVFYPDDDIVAVKSPDGKRVFTHKDGTPY